MQYYLQLCRIVWISYILTLGRYYLLWKVIEMNDKQMYKILIILIAAFLLAVPVSASINVSVQSVGMTYITWAWPSGLSISNESLDGIIIYNFDPNAITFDLSALPANETHTFCIYTATESGCNTTATLLDTTVYQQITALVVQWWYLVLITAFIIIGMQRKLGWFLLIASIVSLYALVMYITAVPVQTTDINHLPFYMYLFFFLFPYVLIYFKGGLRK